jgi:hypothetical protein
MGDPRPLMISPAKQPRYTVRVDFHLGCTKWVRGSVEGSEGWVQRACALCYGCYLLVFWG